MKICTTLGYIVSLILLKLGHVFRFRIVSRMCFQSVFTYCFHLPRSINEFQKEIGLVTSWLKGKEIEITGTPDDWLRRYKKQECKTEDKGYRKNKKWDEKSKKLMWTNLVQHVDT